MANELQLAAGLKLTNPAPADAYYCKPQVGQAPAQPYASPAEACAFVPQPLRYQGMTVNVAGVGEMSWLTTDLSDSGLVLKFSASHGAPGGGGASLSDFISFDVTQDGEQPFQLPAAATGIAQVQVQTPNPQPNGAAPIDGETDEVNDNYTSFDTATRILAVLVGAGLKAGQILTVRYLYGSAAVGSSGPIEFSDIGGVADPSQLPVADAAYIQQLFDALKPLMDQRYTQI